jgi:hypothetical protein
VDFDLFSAIFPQVITHIPSNYCDWDRWWSISSLRERTGSRNHSAPRNLTFWHDEMSRILEVQFCIIEWLKTLRLRPVGLKMIISSITTNERRIIPSVAQEIYHIHFSIFEFLVFFTSDFQSAIKRCTEHQKHCKHRQWEFYLSLLPARKRAHS